MYKKSVATLVQMLKKREISSLELTQYHLKRIAKYDSFLNSFISICHEKAEKSAKKADEKIALKEDQIMSGIPFAHKDVFCTKDILTTCGSKMLENFKPTYNATVTQKLEDNSLVMLGKTNMDEFAMGSSNENSYFGPVKNPWDLKCVPGGSSGGSAAAVALGLVPIATGTDTGGSVRQPAALCGITGLRPTYGRVSRFGMVAFASSLDQTGILSRSAKDAALFLNVIAGFDPYDATSVKKDVPDYTAALDRSIKGLKIGLPREYFASKYLDNKIGAVVMKAALKLQKMGAILRDINLPHVDLSIPVYYVIASAECSSNLARFDGIRYGSSSYKESSNLLEMYKKNRGEGFGDEVKHRILLGTYVLSQGYFDDYYLKANKIRRIISDDFKKAFTEVDIILGPTSPSTAFKLGSKKEDRISMYLSDIYTVPSNLVGVPAISIPGEQVSHMPVGIHLMANHFNEELLLNVAHQFQKESDYHLEFPNLDNFEQRV